MSETYLVYHYCTVETFKNILQSKVLWLCDLTDSNDEQEVIRTFSSIWEGVKKRLKGTDIPKQILDNAIQLIDQQYETEIQTEPPYGVCFCQKEDISSQWIEYGDRTKGLSLGFDINWFIHNDGIKQQKPHPNIIQSNSIGCDTVIYHSEEFEEQMADVCYRALKEQGMLAWIKCICPTFKHYSGFVKNPTFASEAEIRIVYYPIEGVKFERYDVSVSNLKTNVKKHYEIPWIKGSSKALKSVCIGHNCELSKADVRRLLAENGIGTDIQIKQSECTYRIR